MTNREAAAVIATVVASLDRGLNEREAELARQDVLDPVLAQPRASEGGWLLAPGLLAAAGLAEDADDPVGRDAAARLLALVTH